MILLGDPWDDLGDAPDLAGGLAGRLAAEVRPGHVLHGVALTVTARCGHCDEVLAVLPDGRYALVHLTWGTAAPPYPMTEAPLSAVEAAAAAAEHGDGLVAASAEPDAAVWHAARPGRPEPVCGLVVAAAPLAALWTAPPPAGVTRCPECARRASPEY